ncbi:unnamed protein product [Dibothriocephalus latus]|uniref:Uncharacterized protein n=1 Tax=Dibothriocephalus latus TaxID=60516 RepID=A0A3P7LED3_DIBLA|nr:unnamed protein product [Dibothriocephalus latus]
MLVLRSIRKNILAGRDKQKLDNAASREALKTLHFKLYKSLTILRILLLTCTGLALVFLLGLLVYSLILFAKMDFSVSTAVSRVKTYMRKQEDTPVKSPMEVIL